MRLTLRTMLAYLDEILEPSDAQELSDKIKESDFASNLVHRIRGSVGRLRLGAPKVLGRGMGVDANSVAEYLDNTLPAERVPEMEKICLESDAHLAEVAACHQVLTLVLGEPAQVDPSIRDLVYRVGNSPVSIPTPPSAPSSVSSAALLPGKTSLVPMDREVSTVPTDHRSNSGKTRTVDVRPPTRPEVPAYLRASRSRRRSKQMAVMLLLGLTLIVSGFFALGSFSRRPPLANNRGQVEAPEADATLGTDIVDSRTGQDPLDGAGTAQDTDAQAIPSTDRATATDTAILDYFPTVDGDGDEIVSTGIGEEDADAPAVDSITPLPGLPYTTPPTENLIDDEEEDINQRRINDAVLEAIGVPSRSDPVGRGRADVSSVATIDREILDVEIPLKQTLEPSQDIGRYISDQQVLLRQDESGQWTRLASHELLAVNDRVFVLPMFRPQIVLTSGVPLTLTLHGPAEMSWKPMETESSVTIVLDHGRLVMAASGDPGSRIGLQLGQRKGVLAFGDAHAIAAIEVDYVRDLGTDPERSDPHTVVHVWSASGNVRWDEDDHPSVSIEVGQVHKLVDQSVGQTADAGDLPEWIQSPGQSGLERLALQAIEPDLNSDRPIILSLQELAEHRRVEVRSLAMRCLARFDQFDPLVASLADGRQRDPWWTVQFDTFQEALARGHESSEKVRLALERAYGDDATELYRILWGYRPEELRQGADETLVDYLDHELLGYRVLSFETLRRITGVSLYYHPEQTEKRRRKPISDWQERLKKGQVIYPFPPSAP